MLIIIIIISIVIVIIYATFFEEKGPTKGSKAKKILPPDKNFRLKKITNNSTGSVFYVIEERGFFGGWSAPMDIDVMLPPQCTYQYKSKSAGEHQRRILNGEIDEIATEILK